ncbi:GNAT family N-acetyltransferase [Novacetimonas cocois]|uniref:GNAT family N-acetyltransferase n=1 Tax=Novacetimonas cocois TaxID=1747507 RepID=A0A365YX04_9PROT|nr:GNAT family N-acetyltransferase [Novacetimonas cocois]
MEDVLPDTVRTLTATDPSIGDLLTLNNDHETELSRLDADRFRHLLQTSFLARHIGGAAFVLAFDQDAGYDSPNFLWFRERFARFVYVDRIVVSPHARGRGYARRLYMDLFAHAARAGHSHVVCEVNLNPPNPASDAFHAALGFREVGCGVIHGGAKTVRYLCMEIGGQCIMSRTAEKIAHET